jgi:hypothetical protein
MELRRALSFYHRIMDFSCRSMSNADNSYKAIALRKQAQLMALFRQSNPGKREESPNGTVASSTFLLRRLGQMPYTIQPPHAPARTTPCCTTFSPCSQVSFNLATINSQVDVSNQLISIVSPVDVINNRVSTTAVGTDLSSQTLSGPLYYAVNGLNIFNIHELVLTWDSAEAFYSNLPFIVNGTDSPISCSIIFAVDPAGDIRTLPTIEFTLAPCESMVFTLQIGIAYFITVEVYTYVFSIQPALCFLADSPVHMADGSTKAIQDVQPGDLVIGAFGTHNTVLRLRISTLKNQTMCKLNGEHTTTLNHTHISAE